MTLKRFIYLYIIALVLSAAVARQGLAWLTGILGPSTVQMIPWILLAGTLISLVVLVGKGRISLLRGAFILLSFAGIFLFLKTMRNPDERIHIFQYGLLGFLLMVQFQRKSWEQAVGLTLLIVLLVACADELFQVFLPNRVGDLRDVGFGCVGGAWGLFLAGLLFRQSRPSQEKT